MAPEAETCGGGGKATETIPYPADCNLKDGRGYLLPKY